MKYKMFSCFVLIWVALLKDTAAEADYYDAAANFSATDNPNGVWSYGMSATLTSSFDLFTGHAIDTSAPQLETWNDGSSITPGVFYNPTNSVVASSNIPPVLIQPGQLVVHPGFSTEFSIIRFIAPTSGVFDVLTQFTALDIGAPAVYVLLNDSPIFTGSVVGSGSVSSFSTTLSLIAGDSLDFKVGVGANGMYNNDATAISALISSVPEPSSLILFALGGSVVTGLWLVNLPRTQSR